MLSFLQVPSRRNPYFNMIEKRGEKMSKVMDVLIPSQTTGAQCL